MVTIIITKRLTDWLLERRRNKITLTDLRRQRGYSLQDIADKLKQKGIKRSKQAIWNYEQGQRKIPLEVALVLAKIYKVSVEKIFFYSLGNQSVNITNEVIIPRLSEKR